MHARQTHERDEGGRKILRWAHDGETTIGSRQHMLIAREALQPYAFRLQLNPIKGCPSRDEEASPILLSPR